MALPVAGLALGLVMAVVFVGGPRYIPNFFDDIFVSQYQYFSSGSNATLFRKLLPILINKYSAIALIFSAVFFYRLQKLALALLLSSALIISVTAKAVDIRGILSGTLSSPDYTKLLNYSIASLAVFGMLKLILERKKFGFAWSPNYLYPAVVCPIGIFSLSQFYPLSDPFHGWWAIGTVLPMVAWIANGVAQRRSINWSFNVLALSLAISVLFTLWSFVINGKNNARYEFQHIQNVSGQPGILAGIKSADAVTTSLLHEAQALVKREPRTIILESGSGTFLDLANTEEARKALATCRIKPLHSLVDPAYSDYLKCLQKISGSGWRVALTNNHSYSTGKQRFVEGVAVVPWAVLEPVGTSPIPESLSIQGDQNQFNKLSVWYLKP